MLGAAAVHSWAAARPSLFCFFVARSDHAGNTSASEALFCKTQDLDEERAGLVMYVG